MKYGKYLAKRQLDLPEYANYFMNYKALKKVIKSLSGPSKNGQASQYEIEKCLQENKATFFFRLDRELEKVNIFYLQKEAELKLRIKILCEKKTIAYKSGALTTKSSVSFVSLHEGFQRFRRDLDRLEQFIELNGTGFSKVLKKWDKRSKSQTKELYLSRAVEVQPVFHREILAEMSDLASSCILELEAWADGDSVIFESKQRNKGEDEQTTTLESTDDLYHEFIKTASSQDNRKAINEWISQLSQVDGAKSRITKIFLLSITKPTSDSALVALYESGYVDLHACDEINGQNCLHKAAISGRDVVINLALENNVDVKKVDAYGRTALHYICINRHREFIKPLLDHGADIDALDKDNFSPLLYSIINKFSDCVTDLIDLGAKVDVDSEKDYIPLNLACQYGVYNAVKILLEKCPKTFLEDAEGLFPIHIAARAGHHELIPLLVENNMSVNEIDKLNKWTALFYAASEGHPKTVKALLDNHGKFDFLDEDGHTALYYAMWEGNIESAQELVTAMRKNSIAIDPSVSIALSNGTEVNTSKSSPENDTADMVDAMDISDIDGIPDLALPPPILPLRKYGHNFLDKKTFVQLFLDIDSNPIQFDKGDAAFPAGRLTIASRNNRDIIPRSINFPLSDNDKMVSFQVDSLDNFAIDFEIYPTYGTRIIAKSTALPYIFNATNQALATIQSATLPLFDLRLQTIGRIKLRFQVVTPFSGQPLEITKFDTYWKSTSQVEQPIAHPPLNDTNGQSQVQMLLHSEFNLAGNSAHHNTHVPHALSLVTASSLSGEYCRIQVCITKDLVPVVSSSWTVEIVHGIKIPIGNLDLATLLQLAGDSLDTQLSQLRLAKDHKSVHKNMDLVPLEEFLNAVSTDIKFDVCVFYPTLTEASALNVGLSTFVELNRYVDTILTVLFDHVRSIRAKSHSRTLIFSSSHPDVCTVLNWKQPNYPVFFNMNAVSLLPSTHSFHITEGADRRCTSLKDATQFASSNNLLGIIVNAEILTLMPALVTIIRASGLVLVADTGSKNFQSLEKVDGLRDSESLVFKSTIDM